MDRIQSAIAKARAARQGDAPTGRARAADPGTGLGAIAEAWNAMPSVTLDPKRLRAGRMVAYHGGQEAAPFDMMRTKLVYQLRERGWTRVAITSPGSGSGKTTTCLNLAFSLARQPELRVMALELDLQRPSMTGLLGLGSGHRFASVLEGMRRPEDELLRVGPNLAIGVTSERVAHSSELLASSRTGAEIDAIEDRFRPDVMLFDMPPVLVGDDTLAFADQVDCALIIAEAEQSTVSEIDRAGEILAEHVQILGVVLNKCRFSESGTGYSHGD
ncbi:MAG: CpsD/CapB family tyrosine-protein kinase [Rhodobacteraceae bacterium]|jgi:Mrp family chromosome partitioning ATPase|nr:CpsD/CapB family tyrosine-protein kinase [Paracoccaceae bacterium]